MKKIGLIGIVAGALSAAVISFAGPAQADGDGFGFGGHGGDNSFDYGYGHDHRNNPWLNQLVPSVKVPHVDTSVHN
jgi:hypothetical protein